ncbi:hypothetical protein [Metabacillus fastidiosus]|uniref:hypothetical protein n=1 Tax=Metabacillus fastidiosus TaxID=1458 RepID=UPI003D29D450
MKIRNKKDIATLLNKFEEISQYDKQGEKHYIFFTDKERGGICTIMRYQDGSFTTHSRGNTYCDNEEKLMRTNELFSFIWRHRKAFSETVNRVRNSIRSDHTNSNSYSE